MECNLVGKYGLRIGRTMRIFLSANESFCAILCCGGSILPKVLVQLILSGRHTTLHLELPFAPVFSYPVVGA